ncbi:monocarboxylate transporter 13-like isoform X2 [Corticium candelabrum]|uniref:monocarboxylate transporter 13-like isoform X2 n=1 Tax=Corticium candelabrum TaxID=121492 RepID=UPI002E271DAA|nr:monocarboxylate transporter 13-like isoform X2 [Corticium candelabrum]
MAVESTRVSLQLPTDCSSGQNRRGGVKDKPDNDLTVSHNYADGDSPHTSRGATVTDRRQNVPYRRRRSSIKVLMLPTKAVDKGWSWVVCVACFVTTFTLIGILASFGVLYIGLLEFYGGSNGTDSCSTTNSSSIGGQTAWIGNQATLFTFLLGPMSAAMAARMGVRPVIITGAIIFTTGMLLTAATNEIWQATLTYGVMGGLGASMVYTPVVGILPAYFDKRKAFAVCFAQSGSWIGNIVLVTASTSIRQSYNWRVQCLFLGGMSTLAIIMGVLYRPRPPQAGNHKQPSIKEVIVQSCNSQRHIRFAVWVWSISLHFFQFYFVLFHLARHAECKMRVDPTEASLLLTYIAISAAVFSIIGGIVQDRMQNKILVLQLVMFVGGVTNVMFPYMTEYSHLVGFAILTGFSDSFISLMSVIPQELVGVKEAVNAFGVLSFTSAITGALGGPAGGWAYDAYGSYNLIFVLSGVLSILASLSMFVDFYLKRRSVKEEEEEENKDTQEPQQTQDVITTKFLLFTDFFS